MRHRETRGGLRLILATGFLLALTGSLAVGGSELVAPTQAATVAVASANVGGRIAFTSDRDGNSEIYAMNADGADQTRLTFSAGSDTNPDWSPDGSRIAFHSDRDGNLEIYVMNADGSSETRLTSNPGIDWWPAWSPDGTQIAYTVGMNVAPISIWVMNADGSDQRPLTSNPGIDAIPAWSPDGSQIAFHSSRDGFAQIYVMNADGSGQTRLTFSQATDRFPEWSPDGSQIAFESLRDGNFEIYVMQADGSGQTRLTADAGADRGPTWSPDGSRIAFASTRDGDGSEIYVMNTDGSNQRRLTFSAGFDQFLSWTGDAAPTRTIVLAPGGNLVGWGGATPVGAATAAIAGQFDALFSFDNATQAFRSFRPAAQPFLNTLSDLVLGDGVWINVTDPDGALWEQPVFDSPRDVALGAQFNLVMWTGPDGTPVVEAIAGIADALDALFTWDADAQAFLSYRPSGPAFLNTATTVNFGDGIWLLMTRAATWSQPEVGQVIVRSDTFNAITSRGTIRVGVRGDSLFGPLADFDNGTGFELELAREVAARVFGAINVELVATSAADRFSALQDGSIDLLIRTTSHFVSREELAAPTSNYFLGGLTATVLASSGITTLADFEGRTLAVGIGTGHETELQQALADAGVAVDLIELGDLGTAVDLLDSGQADGLAWSYQFATAQGRDDLTTILISLDDPWAMWTASPDFRDEVEEALLALIEDGTWETLFSQAFGFDAPWTIAEMLAVPPIDG